VRPVDHTSPQLHSRRYDSCATEFDKHTLCPDGCMSRKWVQSAAQPATVVDSQTCGPQDGTGNNHGKEKRDLVETLMWKVKCLDY
jgi:hypothetical protein